MKTLSRCGLRVVSLISLSFLLGCTSGPEIKQQSYAKLRGERTFEAEYPRVWKALEAALQNHKVVDRDPKEVAFNEWKDLRERSLETDWIFSQSRDKYHEYTVNGFPRKKLLQLKFRYFVQTRSVMGGVEVAVRVEEEVERLKNDGSPAGYEVAEPDSARAAEFLDRINAQLLALPEL